MSNYVTDMTKKPIEMVLGLLNNDNNLGLVEADVELKGLTVVETPEGKIFNTSIDIDLLTMPSEVVGDFVTFFYKRVDLTELFGDISANFREVDVPLNENGLPVDNAVFYAEALRKFGVAMTDEDFEITKKANGVLTVTAKATNIAYLNSFDIAVIDSLASRVAITQLVGFEAPTPAPVA